MSCITLIQVAELTGKSEATVSLVLNSKQFHRVSPKTRREIEAVAERRAEGLLVPGLSDGEQEVVEQMRITDDAHIDIEAEAALPDAYVSQQAERLKLYRELDSTKDEEA